MAKEKNDMNCIQISLFQEKNAVWINDIWDEKKKEKQKIDALIHEHTALVPYFIKKMKGVSPANYDDVYQVGMIALWKAAKLYDESQQIKFSTFASTCIKRAMYTEIHGAMRNQDRAKLSLDNENDLFHSKILEIFSLGDKDAFSAVHAKELLELVRKVEKSRTIQTEKKGIRAVLLSCQGLSNEEIAKEIGVKANSVRALQTVGRRTLLANPIIRAYISNLSNDSSDSLMIDLLGEPFRIIFSDDLVFDITGKPMEYETRLCELLSRENVADWLLNKVKIGDQIAIYDAETSRTTVLTMHVDSIEVSFAAQPHALRKTA